MKRKLIKGPQRELSMYDLEGTLDEIVTTLKRELEYFSEQYPDAVELEFAMDYAPYDDDKTLFLRSQIMETEEQMAERVERERAAAKAQTERELAELRRLQLKHGDIT